MWEWEWFEKSFLERFSKHRIEFVTKSWQEAVQNRMVVMVIPIGQKKNLHSLLILDLLYAIHIKEMVRKVTVNLKML